MRSFWIGGIVVLGLLAAGCSTSGSGAGTTTTKAKSHTSTTLGTGPITPTAKDKTACAALNEIKSSAAAGKKVSPDELKSTIKTVRKAHNAQLRRRAKAWALATLHKHTAAAAKAETRIEAICTRMGLTT